MDDGVCAAEKRRENRKMGFAKRKRKLLLTFCFLYGMFGYPLFFLSNSKETMAFSSFHSICNKKFYSKMHCIRSSILQHVRVSVRPVLLLEKENAFKSIIGKMNFTSGDGGQDQILSKVIELVKKYDKTNASKLHRLLKGLISRRICRWTV
ncbi:hypothetical protein EUTSA_v10001034mg [Eutrema salsugineum]|uniref:Uncharacterized protein n=1 Tax=Eutrema salsugineum TaxID=72664 RepID=V4LJB9_EUTSA|nr:hypothetical protein EUTSA_v10001034mg [Eutrema salsugineum]